MSDRFWTSSKQGEKTHAITEYAAEYAAEYVHLFFKHVLYTLDYRLHELVESIPNAKGLLSC